MWIAATRGSPACRWPTTGGGRWSQRPCTTLSTALRAPSPRGCPGRTPCTPRPRPRTTRTANGHRRRAASTPHATAASATAVTSNRPPAGGGGRGHHGHRPDHGRDRDVGVRMAAGSRVQPAEHLHATTVCAARASGVTPARYLRYRARGRPKMPQSGDDPAAVGRQWWSGQGHGRTASRPHRAITKRTYGWQPRSTCRSAG